MTLTFSFIPAPNAHETPAERAQQLVLDAQVGDDGFVKLPSTDAQVLATTVAAMRARERNYVLVEGTPKEVAHVAIVTLSAQGVQYGANNTIAFSPRADARRFFERALPVDASEPNPDEPTVEAERPAELDEALQHLKRAGEALLPLVKREGKELLDELKLLFR